eukprot:1090035-Prorocentrum_minimum.AAC.1
MYDAARGFSISQHRLGMRERAIMWTLRARMWTLRARMWTLRAIMWTLTAIMWILRDARACCASGKRPRRRSRTRRGQLRLCRGAFAYQLLRGQEVLGKVHHGEADGVPKLVAPGAVAVHAQDVQVDVARLLPSARSTVSIGSIGPQSPPSSVAALSIDRR